MIRPPWLQTSELRPIAENRAFAPGPAMFPALKQMMP